MDREIPQEVQNRRTVKRVAATVIGIAAIAFFFAATIEWLRPSLKREEIRTARVERGAVEATLTANGTVVPLIEQVVSSPVEARVTRIGRRAGDRVRAGDELLTLDTAATRLDVERLDQRVAQKESEGAKLRLQLEETIASLTAQIEQKKLDAEIYRYNSEQKTKLLANGLVAEHEALAARAAAKKSDIELRQLEQALVRARRSRDADLAASANELQMVRSERAESRRQLDLAMLRADREGVLTYLLSEEGATVRRGDVLARIADLSAYRVAATISDIHAARLAAGQRAYAKLEDGTRVAGTIASIDPRIENGVVRFHVQLGEPSHRALRNNLRVDVFVVTDVRHGVLAVQRGSLNQTDSGHAFVIRGDEAVRVPVRFGFAGDDRIEIAEGVAEGDEVVISNMNDYRGVKQLRLKK
jgi:HlyD family secretion protein